MFCPFLEKEYRPNAFALVPHKHKTKREYNISSVSQSDKEHWLTVLKDTIGRFSRKMLGQKQPDALLDGPLWLMSQNRWVRMLVVLSKQRIDIFRSEDGLLDFTCFKDSALCLCGALSILYSFFVVDEKPVSIDLSAGCLVRGSLGTKAAATKGVETTAGPLDKGSDSGQGGLDVGYVDSYEQEVEGVRKGERPFQFTLIPFDCGDDNRHFRFSAADQG